MPFLCCCRKKPAPAYTNEDSNNEMYTNYNEELRELEQKYIKVRQRCINLETQVTELTLKLSRSNAELEKCRRQIQVEGDRETKIIELTEKLDLQKTSFLRIEERLKNEIRTWKEKFHSVQFAQMPESEPGRPHRRPGVDAGQVAQKVNAKIVVKSPEETKFLQEAFVHSDLLKNLNSHQVSEMVQYMQLKDHPQNDVIIKEGVEGDRLYILQSGKCDVTQGGRHLNVMQAGTVFGELAILYHCKRTATITAKTQVKVWYLERAVYQTVMMRTGKDLRAELIELVKNTSLRVLGQTQLQKVADAVVKEEFGNGEYIVRQGAVGKTFYIIKEGEVDVTCMTKESGDRDVKWIRSLKKGDYFGEKALQKGGDVRTANIIALSPKVVCLTLEKEQFKNLIGDAASPHGPDQTDAPPALIESPDIQRRERQSLESTTLRDLEFIAVLGQGGFGRVELVCKKGNSDKSYALKCMKKIHILETKQEQHIFSEKNIMMLCNCQFIVQLYKTFKNDRYVYMLMEACLGGELWSKLRDENRFNDSRSRFYTACVVEALDYLHQRGIVYRDLKPENLLLDERGYVKIVDFGFAKRISSGERTWTFCGTPEYVAPEIILNQGHDIASDYWALGILIFEFLTGNPPFNSADAMRTYRMALSGIDAIQWPQMHIKRSAENLIRRLCREQTGERLGNLRRGISDIRDHKWFNGFDWNGLRSGELCPEFLPEIEDATDTRNFDRFDRDEERVPTENSGWDKDF